MKRVAVWASRRPVATILVATAITLVLATQLPRLHYEADMTALVPEDDPEIRALRDAVEEFGSQTTIMVAIKSDHPDGIYNADTLARIDEIARRVEALDYVEKVTTPLNAQLIRPTPEGMEISPAAPSLPQTRDEIDTFRERMTSAGELGRLVSHSGKAAAILVLNEPGVTGRSEAKELSMKVRDIALEVCGPGPDQAFTAGEFLVSGVAESIMKRNLRVLVPIAVIIVVIVLSVSFRSPWGVFLPLVTVLMSVVWATGILVACNRPFTLVTTMLPVILVAVGTAYGIHVLNRFNEEAATTAWDAPDFGATLDRAIAKTLQDITDPVLMASLTTVAGFMSLGTSFIRPVREFGYFTSLGVLSATVLALTVVPSLIRLAGRSLIRNARSRRASRPGRARGRREGDGTPRHDDRLGTVLAGMSGWSAARPWPVVCGYLLVIGVFLVGALRLEIETSLLRYFKPQSEVNRATSFIESEFGGTMRLAVVADTGSADGVKDPRVLQLLSDFEQELSTIPHVSNPTSIASIVKDLNWALNYGRPEEKRIPESPELVSQELLLFTLQGGSGLDAFVDYGFQKALVAAQVQNMSTRDLAEVIDRVERILPNQPGVRFSVVGVPKILVKLVDRFVRSQVRSLGWSGVAVAVVVGLIMRSAVLGIVCVLPLVLTIVVNFGVMGFGRLPLDFATIMLSSIAVGTGIDYSIHFTNRYRAEVAAGRDRAEAARVTARTAGRGIVFNAIAVAAGFAVNVFSDFRAVNVFGILIAGTMITSSFAALTVIPALLALLPRRLLLGGLLRPAAGPQGGAGSEKRLVQSFGREVGQA